MKILVEVDVKPRGESAESVRYRVTEFLTNGTVRDAFGDAHIEVEALHVLPEEASHSGSDTDDLCTECRVEGHDACSLEDDNGCSCCMVTQLEARSGKHTTHAKD